MTNEQAKSELMQIYGSLSEEKKQALDVAIQALDKADRNEFYNWDSPIRKQAEEEKNCDNCGKLKYHCQECGVNLDNWTPKQTDKIKAQADEKKLFIMHDATPEEQEAIDKYIKSISKPTGVNFWDLADGEYISKTELLQAIDTWDRFGVDDTNSLFRLDNLSLPHYVAYIRYDDVVKCIKALPSVDIPQDHDGCKDCRYQDKGEDELPCCECQQNYMDKWKTIPKEEPKVGQWITEDMFDGDVAYRCSECDELFWLEDGTPKDNGYDFCPKCGKRMVEPQERSE